PPPAAKVGVGATATSTLRGQQDITPPPLAGEGRGGGNRHLDPSRPAGHLSPPPPAGEGRGGGSGRPDLSPWRTPAARPRRPRAPCRRCRSCPTGSPARAGSPAAAGSRA